MPLYNVCLGRLVREEVDIVVEAKSQEDLQQRLGEVFNKYEGVDWHPDNDWGVEPSDSHQVTRMDNQTEG